MVTTKVNATINPDPTPVIKPENTSLGFEDKKIVDRNRTISKPSRKTAKKVNQKIPLVSFASAFSEILLKTPFLKSVKVWCKKKTAQVMKPAEEIMKMPSMNSSVFPV